MKIHFLLLSFALPGLLGADLFAAGPRPSWDLPPHQQREGRFWMEHWYQRGIEYGNPAYERRFRINAPSASLHPQFGRRVETRENGMMLILAEEDLFQITAAEFYAELWGGHPGSGTKRIQVNGRSTYELPRVGTEDGQLTYSYPVIPLKITDLVNGHNAFQWSIEAGETFWAHSLVDNACLRVALTNGHTRLAELKLGEFAARVIVARGKDEQFVLSLDLPTSDAAKISEVTYQGWYSGYDDNGNLRERDWHGFSKDRRPVEHIGTASEPPFNGAWEMAMLPAQQNVAVRAFVRFHEIPGLVYVTPATTGASIEHPAGTRVQLFRSDDLPDSFWSRAGNLKKCTIQVNVETSKIERAELYVNTWTGGSGEVKEYFKLNGRHLPVAEGHAHIIQYNRLPIDPSWIKKGTNTIELLSDTTHHGIEVISPGPALMVRYRGL